MKSRTGDKRRHRSLEIRFRHGSQLPDGSTQGTRSPKSRRPSGKTGIVFHSISASLSNQSNNCNPCGWRSFWDFPHAGSSGIMLLCGTKSTKKCCHRWRRHRWVQFPTGLSLYQVHAVRSPKDPLGCTRPLRSSDGFPAILTRWRRTGSARDHALRIRRHALSPWRAKDAPGIFVACVGEAGHPILTKVTRGHRDDERKECRIQYF